ncbi:hypothetical protein [Prauserella muralis]|uniref:Uncharacterized protein n=1 Tax=Prauserella muralis TaxID=588067 RepID=A0A2V4BE99_9PSEU|nr:hypothetical protein [Prauserella muralis]PXY32379.1 hypothetical protein BAY60_08925 [Prauserella muralis]TWE23936.1 hypothetical protein FHX69_5238 [Prauserella muralis]
MAASDLNTTVNGSVEMCRDAAEQLDKAVRYAEDAQTLYRKSRDSTEVTWSGPARDAFAESVTATLDPLHHLCYTLPLYSRALNEFADSLDGVKRQMDEVVSKARAGGLTVDGPIVEHPQSPGVPPDLRMPPTMPGDSAGEIQAKQAVIDGYKQLVNEFNRKVDAYNECLAIFTAARNNEKEAHSRLWQALHPSKGANVDAWTIGNTSASAVISGVGSAENLRYESLLKADRLAANALGFQQMAAGKLPPPERARALINAARSTAKEQQYRAKFDSLDKLLKHIPDRFRTGAAGYPGRGSPNIAAPIDDAALGIKAVSGVLKKLPYIGTTLTVGTEMWGASTGEQTWGKAVAKSAGILSGGAVGGSVGSVIGSAAGPWGTVLGGGAGSIIGGFAGSKVVDYYVPEQKEMPGQMHKINYEGMGR